MALHVSFHLFQIVHTSLIEYNEILKKRMELAQSISSIKQQNQELKDLLRQYMSSEINNELQISPTKILMAQLKE